MSQLETARVTSHRFPTQELYNVYQREKNFIDSLSFFDDQDVEWVAQQLAEEYLRILPLAGKYGGVSLETLIDLMQVVEYFKTRNRMYSELVGYEENSTQRQKREQNFDRLVTLLTKKIELNMRAGLDDHILELCRFVTLHPDKKLVFTNPNDKFELLEISVPYFDEAAGYHFILRKSDAVHEKKITARFFPTQGRAFYTEKTRQREQDWENVMDKSDAFRDIVFIASLDSDLAEILEDIKNGHWRNEQGGLRPSELEKETVDQYREVLTSTKYPAGEFSLPATDSLKDKPLSLNYWVGRYTDLPMLMVMMHPAAEFVGTVPEPYLSEFLKMPNRMVIDVSGSSYDNNIRVTLYDGQEFKFVINENGGVRSKNGTSVSAYHLQRLREAPVLIKALLEQQQAVISSANKPKKRKRAKNNQPQLEPAVGG